MQVCVKNNSKKMTEQAEAGNGNGNGNEYNDLTDKVKAQETEIRKMRDEFNSQRAKMKELFLAKEGQPSIIGKSLFS